MVTAVKFLSRADVGSTLDALLDEHDQVHWAVAWGSHVSLAKKLLRYPAKIKHVTFGLAFSQTDPDLVSAMIGIRGCRVVKSFPGGTYDPKVYAFSSGDRVAAIIGSANFTHGGLGKNHEVAVLITGTMQDKALADALAFARDSADLGEAVTPDLAERYRQSHRVAALKPKPARDPFEELASSNANMTWPQYLALVRASRIHELKERLKLLQTVQGWLAGVGSFGDLPIEQRKAIAGFLGVGARQRGTLLDQGWEAFGSMRGAGDFMNRVSESDPHLAHAVDAIPQKGEVTRSDYDRFVGLFARAFSASSRTGGVATGTRLLAMKRPDVFLCVSKPNREETARAMGFRGNLTLDNYWDRVVETIRTSNWYNVEKPEGEDGRIWEGRAAMLDSIYYRPD